LFVELMVVNNKGFSVLIVGCYFQRGDEFESGTKGGAGDDSGGDIIGGCHGFGNSCGHSSGGTVDQHYGNHILLCHRNHVHFYDVCPRLQTPCCRLRTLLQAASSHASHQHFCERRRDFRAMYCESAAVFKRNKEQVTCFLVTVAVLG
jgi:hypothetical protein